VSSNNQKPKSAWRTKTIICPHCYHDHGAAASKAEYSTLPKVMCMECKKKFRVEIETEVLFTTCKIYELEGEKNNAN